MKKILALLLALALVLTACGGPKTKEEPKKEEPKKTEEPSKDPKKEEPQKAEEYKGPTEYTEPTSREVQTMDYVVTALASDHEINANLVDGLLENDRFGKLVGALASEWKANEDKTVWTFELRPGVKWVTNAGEEYDEVKAEDFVTGVRHGAEFKSGTSWLLQGVIDGYSEYLKSDFSDEAWAKVGVKAIEKDGKQFVEFTMQKDEKGKGIPVPYFDSMTTYAVLYPINKTFLESRGEGCKLGKPNKETCKFGTIELDSILYNGAYILTTNDSQSKAVLTKNEAYWDAANVHMKTITRIYDAGKDPYSVIKGFENGTYPAAGLSTTWEDYAQYLEKYKNNATYTLPNNTTFGIVFNYGREKFDVTKYAGDEALRENTRKAVLNENFRKAVRAAYDRVAALSIGAPEELAKQSLRNINNFPAAGTQSNGTKYFDEVTAVYNAATGEKRNLNDGQDTFLNKEEALAYIEKAKAEGIKFPVHLDIIINETAQTLLKRGQSLKKSIEENTNGQIIIELNLKPQKDIEALVYTNNDPKAMDYDISTFTGWGPDYVDPKSFVDIYSPTTGYYMASLGLGTVDKDGKVADLEIKEKLGLMEYEKLYREADKITTDLDARYKAFAKADAYLLQRAIFVPTSQQTRSQRITKVVPFSKVYSDAGMTEYKYKGLKLQDELVTVEQYNKAYEEWQANR
ncbi:MAG: ABC transporter substrate-binding protein [Tissierellia bacterium]|nr:ABC transporter substrate-binding protein [Tissierellia bacterium]